MTDKRDTPKESRHLVIYGYTKDELKNIMRHFEARLPDYVKISISTDNLVTNITLTGINTGVELLRFKMNKYHQNLQNLFSEEMVTGENKSIGQVLGELLAERELTVSCAESCTGGNIAHKITLNPGSSSYFLGSVVSYSNDVKANVLGVKRSDISKYGAVSKEVVKQMAEGVGKLMKSDCSVATSGIAGPDGGTKFKPVGTVWMCARYCDKSVTELIHFEGNRNSVIESASNHVMVMLIKLLRNTYKEQEDISDD
ncbi:MAG: CinA family protein [Candidatus Amulumruptor caecigallinarius]|nr:CinA family protein [Candidatus Amulumruptor caecigallinarius]